MAITQAEAAAALQDIEQTSRRTAISGAYSIASPHLILWGLIWAVGYTGCGIMPVEKWGLIWLPLIAIGVAGAVLLARRPRPVNAAQSGTSRSFLLGGAVALFVLASYTVFQPVSPQPYLVFPSLITALVYVTIGVFGFPRFVWIGAAIFLVSMGAWLFAQPLLPFLIAAAGGGGLILGGLWLRQP